MSRLIDADALIEFCAERWIPLNIDAVNMQPTIQPVATDINIGDKISKFIDGLEEIFADLRERHVDDSVCGLCEYDGAYMGQSGDWCNECPGFDRDDCFKLSDETRKKWTEKIINALPTIQLEKAQLFHGGTTSDLISRQAAIDAVNNAFDKETLLTGFVRSIAVRAIRDMPSAQPEPQWIPVEKELPEPRIDVWVNSDLGQMVGYYDEMVNLWYGRDYLELIVNAWMPLPEAYKPNK